MRILFTLLLFLSAALIVTSGCGPKPPSAHVIPAAKPKDVVDNDFIATIATTKEPLVFLVKVKLVNTKVDKKIHRAPGFVDLELRSRDSGRVYKGPTLTPTYSEEVEPIFHSTKRSAPNRLSSRVRLFKEKLPRGSYEVRPVVRIVEIGKDALHGPYTDSGSVAVPAGNFVKVSL